MPECPECGWVKGTRKEGTPGCETCGGWEYTGIDYDMILYYWCKDCRGYSVYDNTCVRCQRVYEYTEEDGVGWREVMKNYREPKP